MKKREQFLAEQKKSEDELKYFSSSLRAASKLEMISAATLKYGRSRASALLRGDGQRLLMVGQKIDDHILNEAAVERSEIDSAGAALYAIADEIDSSGYRRRSGHNLRVHNLAFSINSQIQTVAADLKVIADKVERAVRERVSSQRAEAESSYLRRTLGPSGYAQMREDLREGMEILSNPRQVENVFDHGQSLYRLSDNFRSLGQEEVASDIDLALMHIAVKDRPDEYCSRALKSLAQAPFTTGLEN